MEKKEQLLPMTIASSRLLTEHILKYAKQRLTELTGNSVANEIERAFSDAAQRTDKLYKKVGFETAKKVFNQPSL